MGFGSVGKMADEGGERGLASQASSLLALSARGIRQQEERMRTRNQHAHLCGHGRVTLSRTAHAFRRAASGVSGGPPTPAGGGRCCVYLRTPLPPRLLHHVREARPQVNTRQRAAAPPRVVKYREKRGDEPLQPWRRIQEHRRAAAVEIRR